MKTDIRKFRIQFETLDGRKVTFEAINDCIRLAVEDDRGGDMHDLSDEEKSALVKLLSF